MLLLKNVKKSYHTHLILDVPSLYLDKHIYWIKGSNGSGKTTFLKMIAGLIPFDGDIFLNNISLKNQPVMYRQNISWAEAEPLFPGFMKGTDLLLMYQKVRKSSQKQNQTLIEIFGLNDFVDNRIETYSAGMLKKLSLALAFTGHPSLIVLDEPLITLDKKALVSIHNFILEKHNSEGVGFLMSSHQELDMELTFPSKELKVINHSVLQNEKSLQNNF